MQLAARRALFLPSKNEGACQTAPRCPSRFAGGLPLGCVEVLGTFRLAHGRRLVMKREFDTDILRQRLAEWMC